jgi:Cellulase (glycosyl hydrolase family 5)
MQARCRRILPAMKPLAWSALLAVGALLSSTLLAQDAAPAPTPVGEAAPAMLPTPTQDKNRAVPIPPPPADRSLLPAPREGVVMVQVQKNGRLNVALGGWGGQRLIQAKTDPEKFRGYIRAVKQRGLNCVRPLFHPPNAANKHDSEWATFDWEAMDRAVAITQEEGVYFLVDYHNWLVNDAIHSDEATWLKNWGWIVDRYKPYKHLIFEGFNEPIGQCSCMAEHYQKWIDMVRSKGAQQMCVVSPFWKQYFAIKDPANNWAQCRHHYMNAGNSPTVDRARGEADHHLLNLTNKNSAASASKAFGCGFFMTEGGIDDTPKTAADMTARMAGVQRIVDDCEKQGYGWCFWAHGDWSNGFDTYGAQVKTTLTYHSITGALIAKQ